MKRITEDILWDTLDEALKNNEIGLIIWPSWTEWENFSYKLHKGNEIYEFILKKVKNNEMATITCEYFGFKITNILAVPIKAMIVYDKFFANVLNICEKCNYQGPITFVISNEIADASEK